MPDLFSETACKHQNWTITLTPELIHYGKRICSTCQKFLGWESNPKTLEKDKENHRKIEFLNSRVKTDFEKSFLLSLSKQGRHFSPRQQETLDNIWKTHGN